MPAQAGGRRVHAHLAIPALVLRAQVVGRSGRSVAPTCHRAPAHSVPSSRKLEGLPLRGAGGDLRRASGGGVQRRIEPAVRLKVGPYLGEATAGRPGADAGAIVGEHLVANGAPGGSGLD